MFGEYDEAAALQIPDSQPSAEVAMDVQLLYEALDNLPVKQRDAVILFEITGFSLEEIRAMQGGTLSGVKARVARGRRKLAKLLGADKWENAGKNGAVNSLNIDSPHPTQPVGRVCPLPQGARVQSKEENFPLPPCGGGVTAEGGRGEGEPTSHPDS